MAQKMKKQLFKIAHAIKDRFATFGDALRHAWLVVKLKVKMINHVVEFTFVKVDGSIRQAYGTLKASILPETKGIRTTPSDNFTYFDIQRQQYRSCKIANIVFNR